MSEYLQGKAGLLNRIHKASISEQAVPGFAIILFGYIKNVQKSVKVIFSESKVDEALIVINHSNIKSIVFPIWINRFSLIGIL